MPLGLCQVGEAARSAGHEVELHDLMFEADPQAAIDRWLRGAVDVVGLSLRNMDNCDAHASVSFIPEARDIVAHIRKICSAPIVLGGAALGVAPRGILETVMADYAVVGDGERTFVELLRVLEGLWWVVPGVLGRVCGLESCFWGGWCLLQPLFLGDKQAQKKKQG